MDEGDENVAAKNREDELDENSAMAGETEAGVFINNRHHIEQLGKPPVWMAQTVTIEPVIFLFIFGWGISFPAVKALFYQKVCLGHFNSTICDHLSVNSNHIQQDIVQKETSHWFLWENYCYDIPAIIMAFVYGSISDRFSRRLAILLPFVGQIFTFINFALNSIYMDWYVGYLLVGITFAGFTGGVATMYLASFSYLGNVTTNEERSKRVLISHGVGGLSLVLPMLVSGLILENTSHLFVFSLAIAIFTIGILYVLLHLKEPPKIKVKEEKSKIQSRLVRFVHIFTDAFVTVFRRRKNNGRMRLHVTLMIAFTSFLSMNAYYTVGYLFLKRSPLNWSQTLYGYFLAWAHILPAFCLLVIINPIKERYKLEDTTLLLNSAIVGPLSELWLAFSTKTWMVFLVPVIGMFRYSGTVLTSTISKFVEPEELGKVYAVLQACQVVSGMLGSTIYNLLYPATLSFWPGFSFCLSAITAIIPISLIGWLWRDMRKEFNPKEKELRMGTDGEALDPLILSTDDPTNDKPVARRYNKQGLIPETAILFNRTN